MMHFLHDAEIAHRTHGRIHLRVPKRCGDALFFIEAGRKIAELDGVTGVSTNRDSLSIIIRHDKDFRVESVAEALAAAAACLRASQIPETIDPVEPVVAPSSPVSARTAQLTATLLQVVIGLAFGWEMTHVLELLARTLVRAAVRGATPEPQPPSLAAA